MSACECAGILVLQSRAAAGWRHKVWGAPGAAPLLPSVLHHSLCCLWHHSAQNWDYIGAGKNFMAEIIAGRKTRRPGGGCSAWSGLSSALLCNWDNLFLLFAWKEEWFRKKGFSSKGPQYAGRRPVFCLFPPKCGTTEWQTLWGLKPEMLGDTQGGSGDYGLTSPWSGQFWEELEASWKQRSGSAHTNTLNWSHISRSIGCVSDSWDF